MQRTPKNKRNKIASFHFTEDDETNSYQLHDLISVKHIIAMKERFEKHSGRHMSKSMFRKALLEVIRIYLSDNDFETLCQKLNFVRTLTDVYWEEFLTYIRVGLDSATEETFSCRLELPITGLPVEIRTRHRLPISRMLYIPEIQQDRKISFLYGVYVTCSRDGLINYWSMDLTHERTVCSKSPTLKNQQTWVTDIIALPDVSVICISSSERDLRFYDTTAQKFELRVYIINLENMITAMHYTFYDSVMKDSKLLLGNSTGKVKLIYIAPKDRGAFKSLPKLPLRTATYSQFAKGCIAGMTLIEIQTEHTDWVKQLSYYENIHSVVSISPCSHQSMLIYSAKSKKNFYSFKVPKGFTCFTIVSTLHLVITGGADFLIRVWNPFLPSRALSVLRGHHAGIVSIIPQDDNRILISLDNDKCIKVWDLAEQKCLQSFFGLPSSLGERIPLCTFYNPCSRELFVASNKIVCIRVYPLLNGEYTDGVTHSKEVSVILYNKLFKSVVTCGFDSFIIIWNPWKGKSVLFIREAHTIQMYGETLPVEITAATFDPSEQFLITGASDGTLKVWNFIIKNCIRNMTIDKNCEVYSIVWIKYRILVMGENRVVTEFVDEDDIGSSNSKAWMRRHFDDILCASTYLPTTLVTGTYSGELIFWRVETGQPYGMYNVASPKVRITMQYQAKTKPISKVVRKRQTGITTSESYRVTKMSSSFRFNTDTRISINAMLCLTTRPMHPQIGTLMVALQDGIIQMWSIHPAGGYVTEFIPVHNKKDYVVSLCTDQDNNYFFTGHMSGYIKTWHLINFGIPEEEHVHICMPKLRLKFPFLWNDALPGNAKRKHKSKMPLLLNSYKAHLKPVTGIVYVDHVQLIFSCSSDCSARIWTLGGLYHGTLGTFKPWKFISPTLGPDDSKYTLPADIEKAASFTTLKVLSGGVIRRNIVKKQQTQKLDQKINQKKIYGKQVNISNILGKHYELPKRGFHHYDIVLDTSLPDVPIYNEIIMPMPEKVTRPPTPDLIKTLKMQLQITSKGL